MKKSTKILIIGFGSIGQRHYRNLAELGYRNVWVYDVDSKRIKDQELRIKRLDVKTLNQFDVAFICSPTHLHIEHALIAAHAGCHLFIEKPLSHNLRGIKRLEDLCQRKKLVNLVGCNMRFHPCLKFIKRYIENKKLGRIYSIHQESAQYLPYWRPHQDYRLNYAVKRSTGGGRTLDATHEFDLLFWFNDFRPVKKYNILCDKVSNLEIETEDSVIAAFDFRNKVLGSIITDYLQQPYSRSCKVVGEKGNLEWDFVENIVWLKTRDGRKTLLTLKQYDFNNMYLDEVNYFFSCVQKREKTFNDIGIAGDVLKYCLVKD